MDVSQLVIVKYMSKIRNADEEIESSEDTGAENTAGAANEAGSQQ